MPVIAFPPRNETLDFMRVLDAIYRDTLQRPPQTDARYVDEEGTAVWLQEWLRLRVNGMSHEAAIENVKRQIDNVVNPPDPQ